MTHVFTKGEYKTRGGRKAIVLIDDAPGDQPLVGYILTQTVTTGGKQVLPMAWTARGSWMENPHYFDNDLVAPVTEPEQVVRWVVLWNSGSVSTADIPPPSDTKPMIRACTRVVLTPGRFDDESTPDDFTRVWNEAMEAAEARFASAGFNDDGLVILHIRALKRIV